MKPIEETYQNQKSIYKNNKYARIVWFLQITPEVFM